MSFVFSFLLTALSVLLAIPAMVFTLEIVAALALPQRKIRASSSIGGRQPIAVVVPAHDESIGIRKTLEDVKAQLLPHDRVLVVADNCSDDTAAVARTAGAEVIERHDPTKRGKGYALEFGLTHLKHDPPATVIIIDADCRVAEGTIDRLATVCAVTHRPAQALDLMVAPDDARLNYSVAEFAWRVKNWVRPLGLSALGLPCHLMGTGMAFPWETINSAKLASASVVEDLKLGLDMALLGKPALFCPSAGVTSHFPSSIEGAGSQRKRWHGGHIMTILGDLPRLSATAVVRGDWRLFALALDLAVPPLSLFVILLAVMFLVTALAAVLGLSASALTVTAITTAVFAAGICLSWIGYGRDVLPPRSIFSIAAYVFAKLPMYCQIIFRRSILRWKRTDRNKNA